jgi:predicted enzyme related to lactoylglutathione lyase
MSSIGWADVPARDLDRAIRFYSEVLGVPVPKQEAPGFALGIFPHDDKYGAGGCLFTSEEEQPVQQGILIYFSVEGRLDEAIAAVEANGGHMLKPRHSIAPHGFRAVILDSEGNRVALHSME